MGAGARRVLGVGRPGVVPGRPRAAGAGHELPGGARKLVVHARDAAPALPENSFAGDEEFFARFRDALRRRLAPNTALHLKQLAGAIGRSERGVQLALAGANGVNGATVAACIAFFWSSGDRGFVAEIYGLPPLGVIAEMRAPLVEELARLEVA